jgi:aminomethyltransferase
VSHETVPIRAHAAIVTPDDRVVGEVTSGTVSPTLGHPVMLARVERGALDEATRAPLRAAVRERRPAVTPAPLPFVPKRYKR